MIKPNALIKSLSVEELIKTADDYFKSIVDSTPQMAKPLSSLLEAPDILQNIGMILSMLNLGKTMTVFEFGAGTCWLSRFLLQLQCQVIACDVSKTALEIGKRLINDYPIIGKQISDPVFLSFDGHHIDLPNESVERIICNDAFHHVPNQEEILSEFNRILKKGGIVGFCEPGRFHSQSPQSQYEMKNYNVLENDIDLVEIFELAQEQGFTDIKIKLLCNTSLSLEQYKTLVGKRVPFMGLATDKLINSHIINNVKAVMNDKSIFFLYKGENISDSRSHIGLSHSIKVERDQYFAKVDEIIKIALDISNTGTSTWLNANVGYYGVVFIGLHLYENNKLINLDFARFLFPDPIKPGQKVRQNIEFKISQKGVYQITIDLVSEQVCWFENIGSKPITITVSIT